jgi:lipopolysaccharide export system protein LptC
MSVELHLPDLPEVPLSLGPDSQRDKQVHPAQPWHWRLREGLSSYLPLLLMALLVVASAWLVKNSPQPVAPAAPRPLSAEPDYTMTRFALERFDAAGRLKLRIEGAELRHYPATERMEIDGAQITAYAPDGRVTQAVAKRALGNGDGSELQLLGGAEVTSQDAAGQRLWMRGEFLHAFLLFERVQSHLPVQVQQAGNELQADGLDYDHPAAQLTLKGRVRAVLPPRVATPASAAGAPGGARAP